MSNNRPSLAIIIPGGVGTGKHDTGVPVLTGLVKLICAHYNLTVFSLTEINPGYKAEGFELIDVSHSNALARLLKFPSIFKRHHRRKNFVAVHGFWAMPGGMLAVYVGKRFGVKSIVSLLGGDAVGIPEIDYGRLHKPVMRWLIFWALKNASKINALTTYLAGNLKRYGFKRTVDIIPWGVDRELFDYHPKPTGNPVTFLHVANLHPVKDQQTLLRAFNLIRKEVASKLVIVGTGIDEQKVKQSIVELGLNDVVELREPIPYEQLSAVYHSADVLLHTSLSEGQSEVVTEAMSCGLPVCGTRVGLMSDLEERCVVVDVGDYEMLARKTIALVKDQHKMNEIRIAANHWTSEHDIRWTAGKLMGLYGS